MPIREAIQQRPWLGWLVAGLLLLVAAYLGYRSFWNSGNPYSLDRLTQDVVIKDRDTGEEWTMKRGRLEVMLMERPDLDPNIGIPNPKTGKLTGFPKSEWEATVERIKRDRDIAAQAYGGRVPSGGTKPASKTKS